ncbi:MAG: aspartate kinase [Mangrovibacterium sp.]
MKIYKFGGAAVSSADTIRKLAAILQHDEQRLIVVISAMGKTTNALELIVRNYFNGDDYSQELSAIHAYHEAIMNDLKLENRRLPKRIWMQLLSALDQAPSLDFNYEYDQIVSFGELLSTAIVSAFLHENALNNDWIDIRSCLRTDEQYREALVDWAITERLCVELFAKSSARINITQGFIGATRTNQTTTLGREGSDYSAAILGNVLSAQSVTIWKNVPGVLNANPQDFDCTEKLPELSYKEAIELAYSGANVIHPKTMKPLQNKGIPLIVRSYEDLHDQGTLIHEIDEKLKLPPIYIQKQMQVLITLQTKDYAFVSVHELADVFALFKQKMVKVNLIQQAAIQISFCIDEPEFHLQDIINELSLKFETRYNKGLTLATIRYYNEESIGRMIAGRNVLMEQRSRKTIKMVLQA